MASSPAADSSAYGEILVLTAKQAPSYVVGQKVLYFSDNKRQWFESTVASLDADGGVTVNIAGVERSVPQEKVATHLKADRLAEEAAAGQAAEATAEDEAAREAEVAALLASSAPPAETPASSAPPAEGGADTAATNRRDDTAAATESEDPSAATGSDCAVFAPPSRTPQAQQSSSPTLKDAVIDLRSFVASTEGQDLICRTYECYNYIATMSKWCRIRDSRGHQTIKIVAGCASATAGVVVIGATIVGSAGLAAPAVAGAVVAGAGAASLTAGVVSIGNALASLGFGHVEAQFVAQRIAQLQDVIGEWDKRTEAVMSAASKASFDELGDALKSSGIIDEQFDKRSAWAKVMKDRAAKESRKEALKESGEHVGLHGVHLAAEGMHVAAHAGEEALAVAAEGLIFAASGIECLTGLHRALEGAKDMKKQHSAAADELDAQADNFCSILHMMMTAARDTPAYQQLVGLVPQLVYVKVDACKVPKAACRLGAPTIGAYKKLRDKTKDIWKAETAADRLKATAAFLPWDLGKREEKTSEKSIGEESASDTANRQENASDEVLEDEDDSDKESPDAEKPKPRCFFVIKLEPRVRDTRHVKCRLIPEELTETSTEIYLRRFATDDTMSIEAWKLSGLKGKLLGDRRRGEKVTFPIDKTCDSVQVGSEDGTSVFAISYEIVGNFLSEEEQHKFCNLCKKQDWEAVKAELKRQPGLVNAQPRGSNSRGGEGRKRWTALHQAAKGGNEEMVRFLLSHGAARDATTEERDGQNLTPADVASTEAVRQLFQTADAEVSNIVTGTVRFS